LGNRLGESRAIRYTTQVAHVPFVLGLTGNIACGKSTVGQLLAARHAVEYVDADRVVHALYAPGTPETRAIAARFGEHLLGADGTLDRRRLGDLVMADPAALRVLEAILDPGVMRAIDDRLAHTSARVVALDAIRLIESGLAARCQAVWVVVCDRAVQVERLMATRGLSLAQAELRVAAQAPPEDKLRYATAVLHNHGSLDDLAAQLEAAWQRDVAPRLS
jgi:dephospho-CoA kinase